MTGFKLSYIATAALSGALFGAGLYVSQMVDPLKVLRFLDFTAIPTGGWDPSLAFVIVPAIVVMFIAVPILLAAALGVRFAGSSRVLNTIDYSRVSHISAFFCCRN